MRLPYARRWCRLAAQGDQSFLAQAAIASGHRKARRTKFYRRFQKVLHSELCPAYKRGALRM